ncbi:MAG: sugar phosphate nucleotidyltransferase [Spirochaetota bacterium]
MIENAVILAAGTGTRLKPLTNHSPKCLTEVNGIPILFNALQNLYHNNIKKTTIVTGYFSETIQNTLGTTYRGMEIQYKYNKIYEKTNDIYSLWLARDVMEKGAVILEGDIFFRAHILKKALCTNKGKSYYIGGKYNMKENEVMIYTDPQLRINAITILENERGECGKYTFMSAGILVVQSDYGRYFSCWLDEFVHQNKLNILFDRVLSEHVAELPLYVFEIPQHEWVEIDTGSDLREAERLFPASNIK